MRQYIDLSVYVVADPSLCGGRDIVDVVNEAVKGGVTMVQLRNKTGSHEEVAAQARALMDTLRPGSIPLIINDHVDVAADIGADGVHVGQDDTPALKAREVLGPEAIIGLTAFTPGHFATLDPDIVDYAGTGPVYETKTDKGKPVLGPEGLEELVKISPVPVVGIGGITPDNAEPVMEAGAHGVAMMRSISEDDNPDLVANAFAQIAAKYALKRAS